MGYRMVLTELPIFLQLHDEMLGNEDALDNLHLDIVLQLLQAGADVQAVTAQVRPAAMLQICALLLSSHKLSEDMVLQQHMQPLHVHVCCLHFQNMQALY